MRYFAIYDEANPGEEAQYVMGMVEAEDPTAATEGFKQIESCHGHLSHSYTVEQMEQLRDSIVFESNLNDDSEDYEREFFALDQAAVKFINLGVFATREDAEASTEHVIVLNGLEANAFEGDLRCCNFDPTAR